MMSAFAGYLLQNSLGETIDEYIEFESYDSTPNQREEIDAWRDDNTRELFRETAEGMKTVIHFTTTELNMEDKEAIQQFFKHATVIDKERKVQLTYWNDEDNAYKTSYFYIADIKFTVSYIEGTNVVYNPIEINLVEY